MTSTLHCGRSIGGVNKPDEGSRVEMLLDAQNKAAELFAEIERSGMIRAGVREQELSNEIRDLAADMFGVSRHWHKRIVRTGENTLQPYRKNPPDLVIADDDIMFCDIGPIFERWEADFGRTYVLGDDAACTPCATTYRWCGPRAGSTSSRARTSRGRSCSPTSSS